MVGGRLGGVGEGEVRHGAFEGVRPAQVGGDRDAVAGAGVGAGQGGAAEAGVRRERARAHARSGDRIAIAAYLGSTDTFERAVADFALSYATQTTADHAALGAAVAAGVIAAAPGI